MIEEKKDYFTDKKGGTDSKERRDRYKKAEMDK